MKDNVENEASVKKLEIILNNVEKALSNVNQTLGELDQALNGFELTLNRVGEAINGSAGIVNQAHALPHFQCLYDPVAQAAVETVLAKANAEQGKQLYDPEFTTTSLNNRHNTGDTLNRYRDCDDEDVGETVGFKGLVAARISQVIDEDLLRKDSDFIGYAADDEESPSLGKSFEN
jgi:hypothetical protein